VGDPQCLTAFLAQAVIACNISACAKKRRGRFTASDKPCARKAVWPAGLASM